jgi:maltose O-acetyltransferase
LRLRGAPLIERPDCVRIGDDVFIDSLPVRSHFSAAPGAEIVLADGVRVGHGAAIAARASVRIGEGAALGPFALILDTDFHEAGDRGSAGASAPIVIGAGAVLGPRVTVLRGARIGAGARVEAGSVVTGDIPRCAIVSGHPARVQSGPARSGSVAEVVQRVFDLKNPPLPTDGPHTIPAWDSLGALRLLVALEELGLKLRESDLGSVASLMDLEALASLSPKST